MKLYIHLEKVTITKRANKIFIQNTHLLYKQKVILEILASQYYKQKILYFENIKRETYKLLLMFIKAMIKDDEPFFFMLFGRQRRYNKNKFRFT